jgi:excisionase family DNA binding protein
MKAYLNASEVAKLLNVDRATVSRWLKRGLIPNAVRVMDKQQWRIPLSSYEELVRQQHHEGH